MTGLHAHAAVDVQAPPQRVWEALTDPAEIARYMMGSRVETTWEPGSPITWSGEMDGRSYQDRGKVLEVEPGQRLAVTHWSPLAGEEDAPENYHTIRYELAASDGGTRVTLDQDGCASEEQAQQFSQNWQGMLDGLKQVAEAR
jgi:uncharacterized protein YndB with AHSA1/START domain